ncbi:MAG: ABC transporter ATP-binding protein [Deltaproteobacteria bacterium]|jgi:ABC-type cobalamin/Fe3+-siderophores transport system ATPase subunit|nr:ABC transporter ATP-binding protein [Deltaproteobacteria bacterium]
MDSADQKTPDAAREGPDRPGPDAGPVGRAGSRAASPRQAPSAHAPAPALKAANLSLGSPAPALRGITFEAAPATTLAVAGPNGCGKTLLLKALAGMTPPAGGSLAVFGREASPDRPPAPPRLYVPRHDPSPPPFLSVLAAVALGRAPGNGTRPPRIPEGVLARAREALALLGAEGTADLPLWELPEGAVHEARLARAVFHAPPVLILDEPVSGRSPEARARVLAGLKRCARERGTLVVCSLHDPDEILDWADLALLLRGGLQEAFGPPRQVLGPSGGEALFGPAGGAGLFRRGLGSGKAAGSTARAPEADAPGSPAPLRSLCPVALSPSAFERSGLASFPRGGEALAPRAWPGPRPYRGPGASFGPAGPDGPAPAGPCTDLLPPALGCPALAGAAMAAARARAGGGVRLR